jgi:hypothetical protein
MRKITSNCTPQILKAYLNKSRCGRKIKEDTLFTKQLVEQIAKNYSEVKSWYKYHNFVRSWRVHCKHFLRNFVVTWNWQNAIKDEDSITEFHETVSNRVLRLLDNDLTPWSLWRLLKPDQQKEIKNVYTYAIFSIVNLSGFCG